MHELPRIDPGWTRRRRPPEPDNSFAAVIVFSVGVLLAGTWTWRSQVALESASLSAQQRSKAIAAAALLRQSEAHDERIVLNYLSEEQAARELKAAGSASIEDKAIHRCVHGNQDTYQLGPCRAPWADAPHRRAYSRQQNVAEQAAMQARAEARLRAEERRFAALTGQHAGGWQPGYSAGSSDATQHRCASAKARRDEAYRLVGNDRTFDFIRDWDDVVFQACKNG